MEPLPLPSERPLAVLVSDLLHVPAEALAGEGVFPASLSGTLLSDLLRVGYGLLPRVEGSEPLPSALQGVETFDDDPCRPARAVDDGRAVRPCDPVGLGVPHVVPPVGVRDNLFGNGVGEFPVPRAD